MSPVLNVEFGGTSAGESTLSVKVKVPAGQMSLEEFRGLLVNGVLKASLSAAGKQHAMWDQSSYGLAGRFQVESITVFEGELKFTLSCERWALQTDWLTTQDIPSPDDDVELHWYALWGMFGALANKSGTLEVERVGSIERKPVGRPRKAEAVEADECEHAEGEAA